MKQSQSLLMALACAFILAFPPQVHEIYRAMAEAIAIGVAGSWLEPALSAVFLVLLCWGLVALDRTYVSQTTGNGSGKFGIFLAIAAQLPILGAALGAYWSRVDGKALEPVRSALKQARLDYMVLDGAGTAEQVAPIADRFASNIVRFNDYLLCASIAAVIVALLSAVLLLLTFGQRSRRPAGSGATYLALASILVSACLIALFAISGTRVTVARVLMPVPLLATALFLASFWLSWLRELGRSRALPIITCIVLAAILFSALDLNDDHRVRSVSKPGLPSKTTLDDEFRAWLKARIDPSVDAGKKFPIYLVAAQGGGIYAAYHAASFLASVQDDCPRFGRHIFAISGVSGGSVGSSVFASLLYQANEAKALDVIADRACRKTNDTSPIFQDAVDEVLSKDYLTPLLGGLLFTVAFQQVVPGPVGPFDRARSLELGLEQSWRAAIGSKQFRTLRGQDNILTSPLSSRFTTLWQPSSSPVPALVLNTTEVNTGRRRVIAPFQFDGIDVSFLPVWSDTDLAKRFPESVPDVPSARPRF